MWVLATKPGSSARAADALNHRATALAMCAEICIHIDAHMHSDGHLTPPSSQRCRAPMAAAVWRSAVRTRSSKGQQCLLHSCAPSNHPQPNTRVGRFTEDEKDHGWADATGKSSAPGDHGWVDATGKSSAPGGTSQPENWAHPDWAVWLLLASRLGPMSSVLSQDFRSVPHQLDVNMLGSKVLPYTGSVGDSLPKGMCIRVLVSTGLSLHGPSAGLADRSLVSHLTSPGLRFLIWDLRTIITHRPV